MLYSLIFMVLGLILRKNRGQVYLSRLYTSHGGVVHFFAFPQ
jgi:hypothetical protein